jgi:PAS domain S-box-containing protein
MGALVRTHDWAATPLGPPAGWPSALKVTVRTALTTRHPVLIFWGDEHICLYNDGFRASLGPEKHPKMLGTPARIAWADTWDTVTGSQIAQVMTGGEATWHENHFVPITRHGGLQAVYWTYSFGPIHDETRPNRVGGVLVLCTETTAQVRAEAALRESEARLQLALDASGMVGLFDWRVPDDRVFADARFARLFGIDPDRAAAGVPAAEFMQVIHPEDRPRVEAATVRAVETGEHFEAEYRVLQPGGEARWVAARGACLRDAAGEPVRFTGTVVDIHARKLAEERQALLSREVDHRAKNALAVVLAALRLTQAPDLPSYVKAITGRVAALARAQTLLADDQWTGADLHTLLRGELDGFLSGGSGGEPRAILVGPAVALPAGAAQPLAMAVHELATNATKYGALSAPGGRVAITWSLDGGISGTLRLRWAETGGPLVAGPPARRGFGARVLDGTVRGQLGGKVSLAWSAMGLVCDVEVPLVRIAGVAPDDLAAE